METIHLALELTLGVLAGLFTLLALAQPAGRWLDKAGFRLEAWPDRPMNNGERRARWAMRYHQHNGQHGGDA